MEVSMLGDRTKKIALFVSLSCVLQIAESMFPHPIPGLRLGLANMITLVALVTLGFKAALEVALLRAILSSFLMGTFMSPPFLLSLSGAFISTCAMGFLFWISGSRGHYRFSLIGISILGALCHNLTQLVLAYFILIKHEGVFLFLPWLCIGGVLMGWVTGAIARSVCIRLEQIGTMTESTLAVPEDTTRPESRHYLHRDSFIHHLPSEVKIAGCVVASLILLINNNLWVMLVLTVLLFALVLASKIPMTLLLRRSGRYRWLLLTSFLIPALLQSEGRPLFEIPYLTMTFEGVTYGFQFAFRLYYLMLLSFLLTMTTALEDLTNGFTVLLSFLRFFGISSRSVAVKLTLSWEAIPYLWETARTSIRGTKMEKTGRLRHLIPSISNWVATLYVMADSTNRLWSEARIETIRESHGSSPEEKAPFM